MKRNILIGALLLVVPQQPLQAAPPSAESVTPAAGQRGARFDLTVVGAGLQNASEVMLYEPGVRCESLQALSDNELLIRLKADDHCPPGTHPFRIRTPEGISELQVFRISPLPVVSEQEPNDSLEDAQLMPLNSTVTGVVEAGDVDSFIVTLKKGERLSAEVEAIRTGGAMFDAVLNVIGPDGTWLTSVDDTALTRQDPFVSLIAATDGDYTVQLHETNFEGDDSSRYALHIGTFPRPSTVFPAGGPAGETSLVMFGGDAAGSIEQQISVDPAVSGFTRVFAEQGSLQSPVGMPFRVCEFGNILEQEPNDSLKQLSQTAADLPVALNGILNNPQDVDCFRVKASAGEIWTFEVFACRLGSPVDSVLQITDSEGRLIAAGDDAASLDSLIVVRIPATGEYTVQVADKRGNGSEQHIYRVEVSRWQPQLSAFLSRPDRRSQDRQAISVPRGNRVLTFLSCQRSDFEGDVFVTASGLPAGVTLPTTRVPADRYWVPMVMEAAADSPISGSLADVEASAQTDSGSITGRFRQIVDLVAGSADQLFQSVEVDRLAVAVVEEVPYRIDLQEPRAALSPDGTLDVLISATRSPDFNGPINISFPFLPPWVDGPAEVTIPAGETSARYTLRAWPQAEPRTWPVCAEARAGISPDAGEAGGDSERSRRPRQRSVPRSPVASNLVSLQIIEAPVTGSIADVALEQGVAGKLVCRLQVHGELPEVMTAVVEGLPNRVTASELQIRSSDEVLEFDLRPESSAPVGTFSDVAVRLSGRINGQDVSWKAGRGVLKIEQQGMLVTDDEGRPLSRLEVLRRKQAQSSN